LALLLTLFSLFEALFDGSSIPQGSSSQAAKHP
jgi:hypothetical protein